jgi:hypothetical protein
MKMGSILARLSHHHLVMSAIAYLFMLTSYLEAKKTSGLTLEKILEADPDVATEIDRTLSLLPRDIPEKIDDST